MVSARRWEDLPADLLCRIGNSLDLKCYARARGSCTAWRGVLAPASPSLLVAPEDARCCPSAASLLANRSFEIKAVPWGYLCVGSSDGWLVLSPTKRERGHISHINISERIHFFRLFNPITATQIVLPPLIYESRFIGKVVFAPNPVEDDFAAAAICDIDRLAYVTAGASRWAILDPIFLIDEDQITDVVYHDKGTVYCLTLYGDVHVLRLPERRRRERVVFEDKPEPSYFEYLTFPYIQHQHPVFSGPDLNDPATIEPLSSTFDFHPVTSFGPAYVKVLELTSSKNLVLCGDNMYQIWRNTSCATRFQLPGGGHRRLAQDEVLVLRYNPSRQPCWDEVTDMDGYSVFVGRNNAVSVCEGALPGLKGNCVYWIGGSGRAQGMVFDMETGRSAPCLPDAGTTSWSRQSVICWYFLSDTVNNWNNNGGTRIQVELAKSDLSPNC